MWAIKQWELFHKPHIRTSLSTFLWRLLGAIVMTSSIPHCCSLLQNLCSRIKIPGMRAWLVKLKLIANYTGQLSVYGCTGGGEKKAHPLSNYRFFKCVLQVKHCSRQWGYSCESNRWSLCSHGVYVVDHLGKQQSRKGESNGRGSETGKSLAC